MAKRKINGYDGDGYNSYGDGNNSDGDGYNSDGEKKRKLVTVPGTPISNFGDSQSNFGDDSQSIYDYDNWLPRVPEGEEEGESPNNLPLPVPPNQLPSHGQNFNFVSSHQPNNKPVFQQQSKQLSPEELQLEFDKFFTYIDEYEKTSKENKTTIVLHDLIEKLTEKIKENDAQLTKSNKMKLGVHPNTVLKSWHLYKKRKGVKNRNSKLLNEISTSINAQNKNNDVASSTQSVSTAQTTRIDKTIQNIGKQDFYPYDTLNVLIDDLNYALRNNFKKRIEGKIASYDKDKIKNIFPKDVKSLREEINEIKKNKENEEIMKTINHCQSIVDAADIIHDVGYIHKYDDTTGVVVGDADYITSLNTLFESTKETQAQFQKMVRDIEKTPSNLQAIVNRYKEEAIHKLIDCIQKKTIFPHIEYIGLTLAEGYFEIICNQISYPGSLYRESGRKPTLDNLDTVIKQYESEGASFWEDCQKWCNVSKEQTDEIDNNKPNLYKELLPCTTFDGCGITTKVTHPYDYQKYEFEDVFNCYTYKVFTKYVESEKQYFWKHMIVVYKKDDSEPIAMLSLAQNATIDLLLGSLDMRATRGGDGGKGAIQILEKTVEILNDIPEIITEYSKFNDENADNINKNGTCWGKIMKSEKPHTQIIGLGIKTCGDKVVREYNKKNPIVKPIPPEPNKQELTNAITTDKGIVFSNVLDYFQSDNNRLSGILRSTAKGWTFVKGINNITIEEKVEQFKMKFVSYYYFVLSFGDPHLKTDMKNRLHDLGIVLKNEDVLERFEGINNIDNIYGQIKEQGTRLKSKNLYEHIMATLLASENENRKKRTEKLIKTVKSTILPNIDIFNFSNLPDLMTYFISSLNVFAEINACIYNLFEDGLSDTDKHAKLPLPKPDIKPETPMETDSNEPTNNINIEFSENNSYLKISYNIDYDNTSNPVREKTAHGYFGSETSPFELDGIKFYHTRIDKTSEYKYIIETQVTLGFLIQLKQADDFYNKLGDYDKKQIDSLINELLIDAENAGDEKTHKPFDEYLKEYDNINEKMEVSTGGSKKKNRTRKRAQKKKQRKTLRKSVIKSCNKKTRARKNKKNRVTFKEPY